MSHNSSGGRCFVLAPWAVNRSDRAEEVDLVQADRQILCQFNHREQRVRPRAS